jgi:hypothetical protein
MAQVSFGPSFRWLGAAWRSASAAPELLVRLAQPPAVESLQGYLLHPGLLDGCFQAAGLLSASGETLLPFALESVAVQRAATDGEWWCHVVQRAPDRCDLVLLDAAGSTVAQVDRVPDACPPLPPPSMAVPRGRSGSTRSTGSCAPTTACPRSFSSPLQAAPDWLAAVSGSRCLSKAASKRRACMQALEALSLDLVVAAFDSAGFQLRAGQRCGAASRLLATCGSSLPIAGCWNGCLGCWLRRASSSWSPTAGACSSVRHRMTRLPCWPCCGSEYGDTPELRLLGTLWAEALCGAARDPGSAGTALPGR